MLVITGYFWQFDVSSVLLGQGKIEPREGTDRGLGRLCDMHVKSLYIQVVGGSDLAFDPFLFCSLLFL